MPEAPWHRVFDSANAESTELHRAYVRLTSRPEFHRVCELERLVKAVDEFRSRPSRKSSFREAPVLIDIDTGRLIGDAMVTGSRRSEREPHR